MSDMRRPQHEDPVPDNRSESGLKCPICRRSSAPQEPREGEQRSPYPFCSERCRLVDLGRWLDGRYRIPVEVDEHDEAEVDIDEPPARG